MVAVYLFIGDTVHMLQCYGWEIVIRMNSTVLKQLMHEIYK